MADTSTRRRAARKDAPRDLIAQRRTNTLPTRDTRLTVRLRLMTCRRLRAHCAMEGLDCGEFVEHAINYALAEFASRRRAEARAASVTAAAGADRPDTEPDAAPSASLSPADGGLSEAERSAA